MDISTLISSLGAALISGITTLIVCIIKNNQARKELDEKHQQSTELILYRIDELSKHVEKHNKVIERTFKLESESALLEEKIKVVNHRLEDLEKGV